MVVTCILLVVDCLCSLSLFYIVVAVVAWLCLWSSLLCSLSMSFALQLLLIV